MKLILASVATALALFASISVVQAAEIEHEAGAAIVASYQNCIIAGGFDKSAAPSVSVAPSGRTVLDYDSTIQANLDAIHSCTLPYFAQLGEACDCDEFVDDAAFYGKEVQRLTAWQALPLVNVLYPNGDQETVAVGSPRGRFLMGN